MCLSFGDLFSSSSLLPQIKNCKNTVSLFSQLELFFWCPLIKRWNNVYCSSCHRELDPYQWLKYSHGTGFFLLKILVNNRRRRNCGWLPHIQWWVAIVCRLSRQSLATLRSLWASIQRQCYRYKIVFSSNSVLNCTAAITNTLQLSSSVATSGQQNLATAIMVISAGDRQTKRWSRFFKKRVMFISYFIRCSGNLVV